AEDGIRDFHVTGVQTCALPIFRRSENRHPRRLIEGAWELRIEPRGLPSWPPELRIEKTSLETEAHAAAFQRFCLPGAASCRGARSEERRVGKECRSRRCAER